MNKNLIVGTGALLLVLNAGVLACPDENAKLGVLAVSALVGAFLAGLGFLQKKETPAVIAPPHPTPAPAPAPVPPVPPVPVAAPPRAEAEIVALLSLLQSEGRFVDFVFEEIAGASDQQLGVVARVIHAGCKKVVGEYFEIEQIEKNREGSLISLPTGYNATEYKLLGSVPEQPPYEGTLLHPGWKATAVKLPRVTGTSEKHPWPTIAPAEVEIKKNA